MEPVLVLTLVPAGTDGFLRMTEVMGLNMNADIVALTACQTGLGKRTAGEGTMGMGRAFQYAGAKSVLMSLWSVSEVASVNLVKSFFQNIKEGKANPRRLHQRGKRSERRVSIILSFGRGLFWLERRTDHLAGILWVQNSCNKRLHFCEEAFSGSRPPTVNHVSRETTMFKQI